MVSLLHSGVMELLRANCFCHYPDKNLHKESIIPVCMEDGNEAYIQVIYRARLLTVAGYQSERDIVNAIEIWRHSAEFEQMGGDILLSSSENCPTKIEYPSQPLCRREAATDAVMECPVSVQTLVAYLLGELALLTALLFVGMMGYVCIRKARRKK